MGFLKHYRHSTKMRRERERERREHTYNNRSFSCFLLTSKLREEKKNQLLVKQIGELLPSVSLSVLSKGIRRVLSFDGFTDWSKVPFSPGLVDPLQGSIPESGFG